MSSGVRIIAAAARRRYIASHRRPSFRARWRNDDECHHQSRRHAQICPQHRSIQERSAGRSIATSSRAAASIGGAKYLPDGLSLVHELRAVGRREALRQPDPGPHLRQRLRPGRALHHRQAARGRRASTRWATRMRSRRWCASATRRSSTRTLFRRIEAMMGETMPAGYRFDVDPDAVARAVLAQEHLGGAGADPAHRAVRAAPLSPEHRARRASLSELFKDVFLFHWKDECQHVVLDELELKRHDATALDLRSASGRSTTSSRWSRRSTAILQPQATADAAYFADHCGRPVDGAEAAAIAAAFPQGLSLAVHLLRRRPSPLPVDPEGVDQRATDGADPDGRVRAGLTANTKGAAVSRGALTLSNGGYFAAYLPVSLRRVRALLAAFLVLQPGGARPGALVLVLHVELAACRPSRR